MQRKTLDYNHGVISYYVSGVLTCATVASGVVAATVFVNPLAAMGCAAAGIAIGCGIREQRKLLDMKEQELDAALCRGHLDYNYSLRSHRSLAFFRAMSRYKGEVVAGVLSPRWRAQRERELLALDLGRPGIFDAPASD